MTGMRCSSSSRGEFLEERRGIHWQVVSCSNFLGSRGERARRGKWRWFSLFHSGGKGGGVEDNRGEMRGGSIAWDLLSGIGREEQKP